MRDVDKTKEQLKNESKQFCQGITELQKFEPVQKQVGEMLRESEKRYRQLFEGIGDAVIVYSPQRGFLDCNEATLQRYGYTREEFLSLGAADIVHPDFHGVMKDNQKHIWTEESTVVESVHRCKDGMVIPVEVNARRIDYQGEPAILSVVRDITDRKRAEEDLQASEEKYRALVENANEAVIVAQNGMLKFVNPRTSEITGYSKEELTSTPFVEFVHPDDREIVIERHRRRLEGEEFLDVYPFRIICREGNIQWVEIKGVLIEWEGRPATLNFLSDITERKRAEDALRKQTARNELILQTAIDGFCVLDMGRKILEANHAASLISGYSQEELVGMNIGNLEVMETHEETTRHIKKVMSEGSDRFETRHRRKDGLIVDLEVSNNFVEMAEEKFFFRFFRDITDRKRTGQELKDREKELEIKTSNLEEVNTALRVLLKKRDEGKAELEEKIMFNMKKLVVPYIERLKRSGLDERQKAYVDILESNLNDIISPFSRMMSSMHLNLTPAEMEVANLVRNGKTTKEIAEFLNVSSHAIDFHRRNIRRKLGIRNKKANLRIHLLSKHQ